MNPDEGLIAGATEGTLNWTKKQIEEMANKLKNHDIAFIQDRETIDLVLELRKSGEWDIYNKYVKDKDLRMLVQMGLTLRKIESNHDKLQNLRGKIVNKYGTEGLHISEFVQNGILLKYIGVVGEVTTSVPDLTKFIEDILKTIDKFTVFIKEKDDPKKKTNELLIRTQANLPFTLILFSNKSALKVSAKIKKTLEKGLKDLGYKMESYVEKGKDITFFVKQEQTDEK